MHFGNHKLIGAAAKLPINKPVAVSSISPVVLASPKRRVDLELRVTAPVTGDKLPIILLSHGHGHSNWLSSNNGYGPLYEFWAAHGFAVLQPTHLSSKFLSLDNAPAGQEMFWASRAEDMVQIIDQLDLVEEAVPSLKGRLDRTKIAAAGHSFGAWTTSMLLGTSNTDPRDNSTIRIFDDRIKAGVVLAGTGQGGADLSDAGRNQLVPFYGPDFSKMTTPALIVSGDEDVSPHLTSRGADWHADGFTLGPGPKDLFSVKGGKHGLGGIAGFDAAETKDESPEMLGAVQRMTWAYLRSQFFDGDQSWQEACKVLEGLDLGSVQSKE